MARDAGFRKFRLTRWRANRMTSSTSRFSVQCLAPRRNAGKGKKTVAGGRISLFMGAHHLRDTWPAVAARASANGR